MKTYILQLLKGTDNHPIQVGGISDDTYIPKYIEEYTAENPGEEVISKVYEIKLIKDYKKP